MQRPSAPLLAMIPPPALYAAAFVAGLLLDHAVQWPQRQAAASAVHGIGLALLTCGILIGPGSALHFALRRTTLNPAGAPTHLVTHGAFALSRNPMYLGLAIGYVGLCLALGLIAPLVLLPIPVAVMNAVVIPFEEARMRERFGQSYLDYCRRVRRWV